MATTRTHAHARTLALSFQWNFRIRRFAAICQIECIWFLVHDSWVFHGVAWSLINYRWNANENQFQLLFIEVMFNRWSYRQNICIQLNLTHVQLFFVPPCPSRLRHMTNTISHTKIIVFIENGKYQINASQRSMVNKYRAFIRNHVTRPTYVCAK